MWTCVSIATRLPVSKGIPSYCIRYHLGGIKDSVMDIDRRLFLEHLGGAEAAGKLDPEAKADAMEDFLASQLKTIGATENGRYPTVAEVEERIETPPFRQGAGFLFVSNNGNVKKLPPMPANPTLADFFNLRFGVNTTRNHCLQSAALAMKNGMT